MAKQLASLVPKSACEGDGFNIGLAVGIFSTLAAVALKLIGWRCWLLRRREQKKRKRQLASHAAQCIMDAISRPSAPPAIASASSDAQPCATSSDTASPSAPPSYNCHHYGYDQAASSSSSASSSPASARVAYEQV